MTAVLAWARLDLRTRARSLLVLALLVALATAVVLTAVAGARRGGSAVERLLDRTQPATVAALPNQAGFDWDAVAALPEVEAIARFPLSGYAVDGLPPGEGIGFPWLDDEIMRDIEVPVVLEGRLPDPARPDEVVTTAAFERSYGKGVGDTVKIRLNTPEQVDEYYRSGTESAPAGPTVDASIVGVVRGQWFSDVGDERAGTLTPSPGLVAAYPESFLGAQESAHVNAIVRLSDGSADVAAFREHLAEVSGRRDIDFLDLTTEAEHVDGVAAFEANVLLAFALAASVAAVFLVGQSVVRFVSTAVRDLRVLFAFGMAPRDVRVAAAVGPTLAAVVGATLGAVGAVVASARFPIGTAAPLEPSPGWHADLTVLAAGLVVVPVLVAGGAVLAARPAARSLAADGRRPPSLVSRVTAWTGAPVPLTVGASFALDRGRGVHAVPVLPAVIGAVVGVLGVVASLTFGQGVRDATDHPARFGQVTDLQAYLGFNGEVFLPAEDALARFAADPDVVAVNDTRQGVLESGSVDVPAFAIDPVGEPVPIVLTDGRRPADGGEVTLAPESADALGVGVGDTVELAGSRSAGSFTVSGIAFVPEGAHNAYDSGAWVPAATYDELIEGFKFRTGDLQLRDDADPAVVSARLGRSVADALGMPEDEADEMAAGLLQPLPPPSRVGELEQVLRITTFLAGFLALLAVTAVGHAVATAVRRRRHDLAMLRALGVTRWQSRLVVLVQATVLALLGLSIGVPLGFAVGRTVWWSVAESTPVVHVSPLAVGVLVLIGPVVLLAANLLAAWPSQRAASTHVARVLRTE